MATAIAIESMAPSLLADIKRRGYFHCGVMLPRCDKVPVGELAEDGGMHRLFCRNHMRVYCLAAGVAVPKYPSDGN